MTEAASDEQSTTPTALKVVADFLTKEGWPFEEVGGFLRCHFQGSSGEWICLAHTTADHCLFYSVAPRRAPEVLRPAVAEYLTRANWGLLIGNFEMDYGDGEVRFKTSIQLNGAALTNELLYPLIYGNVAVMDKYLPGLDAIIALTHTPLGAINAVEAA